MKNYLVAYQTATAQAWLRNTSRPTIRHVFPRTCNLINEQGELLSLVTAAVGRGPFALVLAGDLRFPPLITPQTPVQIGRDALYIGRLAFQWPSAQLWSPYPAWSKLTAAHLAPQLPTLHRFLQPHRHEMFFDLTTFRHWSALVTYLAGRGRGATPAGDDFLMGMLYALWALRPAHTVYPLAQQVVERTISRTTTLSAAWLSAAAEGAAAVSWHHLINAWLARNHPASIAAATHIAQTGHTSGLAALSGFVATAEALLHDQLTTAFWQPLTPATPTERE